jgi:Zn-dependent protease
MNCPQCGASLPEHFLVCPNCHSLVHASQLKTLSAQADTSLANHQPSQSLTLWRQMLTLLPPDSQQHTAVRQRIVEVSRNLDKLEAANQVGKPKWAGKGGVLGAAGLLLWKFKIAIFFLLTKAKLLFLGLTKMSTLLSMLLSIGVYCGRWGWKFAVGFVLGIYIHEMGHVYQLRRYGIPATAPMFIPGIGAFIRLQQYPATPHEEAVTGLAGPVWGLGATILFYLLYLASHNDIFAALARASAWLNLFNLIPVWQLDGSHAFKALSKWERAGIAAVMAAMWFLTGEPLLILLVIVAAFRIFQKDAPKNQDTPILVEFAVLVVTLTLLAQINVKSDTTKEDKAAGSIAFVPSPNR